MDQLTPSAMFRVFSFLTKLEVLRFANTNRRAMRVYMEYYATLSQDAQSMLHDLALQMFIKRTRWENTLSYWMIRFHPVSLSVSYLITLPKETISRMDKQLHLIRFTKESYPHPEAVPITEFIDALPIETLYKLWYVKFMIDEETMDTTFHLNAIEKYPCGETEKKQFSKLTWHIFLHYKNHLKITRAILKRLVYWNLDGVFIQLFQVRQCYGLTANTLLPYVLLFPEDNVDIILPCIDDELNMHHFRYLYDNLPLKQFKYFTNSFSQRLPYQQFLRQLNPYHDAEFLRWIKSSENKKYIRTCHSKTV